MNGASALSSLPQNSKYYIHHPSGWFLPFCVLQRHPLCVGVTATIRAFSSIYRQYVSIYVECCWYNWLSEWTIAVFHPLILCSHRPTKKHEPKYVESLCSLSLFEFLLNPPNVSSSTTSLFIIFMECWKAEIVGFSKLMRIWYANIVIICLRF